MRNNDVYKITNKVTGKVYIGITNQGAGARYRHHWYEARIGEPAPIHRSMAKYGEENFTLEILETVDTYDELKEREKYWIKFYDSMDRSKGYNLTEGGDGTFGKLHSEETKEKIRQKAIGRKASEETKKKMSEMRKGKTTDKKHAHIMSLVEKCQQPIAILDVNNNIIKAFRSKADCARYYSTSITLVRTYSEPDTPKLWKKQNIYMRKITLEQYEEYNLKQAA